jgi:hypothetical protein
MSTVRVASFLIPPLGAVVVEPWLICRAGEWVALEEDLRSFDPGGLLELRRTVRFDQGHIRTSCGLSPDDRIGVGLLWSSRLTSLKGAGEIHEPDPALSDVKADLHLQLQGGEIGGSLLLRTVLMLTRSGGEARPLVAHVLGSILWEDDPPKRVDLEGAGTRFPMELRVFGDGNGFPPRAAWYLDWDRGDLSLPVLGSVRLYLNAGHPVMTAVALGDPDLELDRIREALDFDIARQLVIGALANGDFLADPDGFPPGSVGATIRRLCRGVLFQFSTLDELAVRARREPARFEADMQAAISLYWGAPE